MARIERPAEVSGRKPETPTLKPRAPQTPFQVA